MICCVPTGILWSPNLVNWERPRFQIEGSYIEVAEIEQEAEVVVAEMGLFQEKEMWKWMKNRKEN